MLQHLLRMEVRDQERDIVTLHLCISLLVRTAFFRMRPYYIPAPLFSVR